MPTFPHRNRLQAGQIQVIHAQGGVHLQVLSGRLWLTQPGDACDHFLEAGAEMHLTRNRVLVQAEHSARTPGTEATVYVLQTSPKPTPIGARMRHTISEQGHETSIIRKKMIHSA
jgi:hypothetical protein